MRGRRRLPQELLRLSVLRPPLLRRLRPHGAVRPRQRRRRGAHETPRRIAQTGTCWASLGGFGGCFDSIFGVDQTVVDNPALE